MRNQPMSLDVGTRLERDLRASFEFRISFVNRHLSFLLADFLLALSPRNDVLKCQDHILGSRTREPYENYEENHTDNRRFCRCHCFCCAASGCARLARAIIARPCTCGDCQTETAFGQSAASGDTAELGDRAATAPRGAA